MLTALDGDLWVAAQPLRFFGAQVGCRMTCVRLPSGAVAIHSPVRFVPELFAAVRDLGRVEWLIAPNAFHHLYLRDWRERFPAATTLVAPRLLEKLEHLRDAVPLSAGAPAAWGSELEMLPVAGLPKVDEHVFFHRPSATLVLTDLAFHFGRDSPPSARWLARVAGRLGELAPTMVERLLVRDRAALRESLRQILEWPFERVVVAHGEVLEAGGRAALARGFDWLLAPSGGPGDRSRTA